jgi:CO/xanthine dehydrogenase FAD-binding subunit
MSIARPDSVAGALDALATRPSAHLLAGGTDFMVEINFGHRRPGDVVALRRVEELRAWDVADGTVELGAGVTYTAMETDLADISPALAAAARTVGSPAIRNAGTLGGNLGTASPAGDALPFLAAVDAEVLLASSEGDRSLPLGDFVTGPKQTALEPGELIRGVRYAAVEGPQEFLKVGTRNAMVISIACLAVICDLGARRVRVGLGSVAPRPVRPTEAESFASGAVDWPAMTIAADALARFGALVAEACAPITDHRSTAGYRRHAIKIMAERGLRRCLAA